jgi:hypothetical protein
LVKSKTKIIKQGRSPLTSFNISELRPFGKFSAQFSTNITHLTELFSPLLAFIINDTKTIKQKPVYLV